MTDSSTAPRSGDRVIGGRLRAAREQAGLSLDEAARATSLSLPELRSLEDGGRRPLPAEVDQLSAAYGVDLSRLLPPRRPVAFDAATGRLALGGAERRVGVALEAEQVYGAYLALLFAARAAKRGQEIPLRSSDVEALMSVVGEDPDRIEQRLIELMGCTREEASLLRRLLLRHRALAASVGAAAAVALVVAGSGPASDLVPETSGSALAVTTEDVDRGGARGTAEPAVIGARAAAGEAALVGGSTDGSFFLMDELLGDETTGSDAPDGVDLGDPAEAAEAADDGGEDGDEAGQGRAAVPPSVTAPGAPPIGVRPVEVVPVVPQPGAGPVDATPVEAVPVVPQPGAGPVDATPVVTAPVETPPVQTPPVVTVPVETPPVQTPPVQTPPAETPPAETPPAETPPVQTPPAETPPAETPPVQTPPAETVPDETVPAETPPGEAAPAPLPKKKTKTPPGHTDNPGNNGKGAAPHQG